MTTSSFLAQSVAEGECRRAYDSALAAYSTSFDRSTPPEEGPLAAAHSAAVDAALGTFSREAVGSAEVRQPFETKLRAELGKRFEVRLRPLVLTVALCIPIARPVDWPLALEDLFRVRRLGERLINLRILRCKGVLIKT